MKASDYADFSPKEVRQMIREGKWALPTPGMCKGFVQANLLVLPREIAYDFLIFAQRNPKPCPILDITEPGETEPKILAPGANIATDIPRYKVWINGECIDEPADVKAYWKDDLVSFLLGCSFTFESALLDSGIPVRHIEMNKNVPIFQTNVPCVPAGKLHGDLIVTMRPIPAELIPKAVLCTGRYPSVHGAPVHIGDPSLIGITDIKKPEMGDPVEIYPGETPVFWACGCTSHSVVMNSKPSFSITHSPGYMFIGDLKDSVFSVF